eukprot:TRINITY_DN7406_c1_g1_i1.p1 TRINITY_DN7406_c1_g1~~TRINITY_DN7406_c1_g1_i1.p1  ORF type:complete len:685 (+),score=163.96 TRINITY_DN7406_c1_g1_i1:61-2115(+)
MEKVSSPEAKKKKKKELPLILSAPPEQQVEETSKGLLREFMHSKKFKKTLQAFDTEQPRGDHTIASRALMSDLLEFQKFQERNSKKATPRNTLLEVFCEDRVRRREYSHQQQQESDKLPLLNPEDSDTEETLLSTIELKKQKCDNLRTEIQKKKDLQQKLTKAIAKERKKGEAAQQKLDKAKAKAKDKKQSKKKTRSTKTIDDILLSGEKVVKKNKRKTSAASTPNQNQDQDNSPTQTDEGSTQQDEDKSNNSPISDDESIASSEDSYTKDLRAIKKAQNNDQPKSQTGWSADPITSISDSNDNTSTNPDTIQPTTSSTATSDWPIQQSLHMSIGRPMDSSLIQQLRTLLCGSHNTIPEPWSQQGFFFSTILKYGLVQNNGGPCGVLSVIQGRVLKKLFMEMGVDSGDCGSQITTEQQTKSVIESLVDTLTMVAGGGSVTVAFPPEMSGKEVFGRANITLESWRQQNVGRGVEPLREFFTNNIDYYTNKNGTGLLSLVLSAILTRGGPDRVASDMDEHAGTLIVSHQYSSQELVNLLLIGRACSNVFDGKKQLGSHPDIIEMCGVEHPVPDIGFLSFRDFTGDVSVGKYYKNPPVPIFCIWNESHYTVCFAKSKISIDGPLAELYYYDQLGCQDEEYHLSVDATKEFTPDDNSTVITPYMDDILRTRDPWNNATVDWNGSDGLL